MRSVAGLGAVRRPGLVPLGDLFNHADEERYANVATTSDIGEGAFIFYATSNVRAGDEALVSYSLHSEPSNAKLLLDYGFCVPYNLHDEVSIAMLTEEDEQAALSSKSPSERKRMGHVRRLLKSLQLESHARSLRLTLLSGGVSGTPSSGASSLQPPPEMVACGRVLALSAAEAEAATAESVLGAQEPAFERSSLRLIAERIRRRLRDYESESGSGAGGDADGGGALGSGARGDLAEGLMTSSPSHDEDERRLADGEWRRTSGEACVLHVRAGERRILHTWLRLLQRLASGGEDDGCYTGRLIGEGARARKRSTGFAAYAFPLNGTHMIDPTDEAGSVPDDTPHEMALVNEPRGKLQMPNLWPMDYHTYGQCRDRDGRLGVPYYATRAVMPGEELTVCYGKSFNRAYVTPCEEVELIGRWGAMQARLIARGSR